MDSQQTQGTRFWVLWNCETMAHKGEECIARRVREASLWTKAEGEPASYSQACL